MAFGTNFYDEQPYQDFSNLSRHQSAQSIGVGERAAQLADPYAKQRERDIESLRLLDSNPGSITTSPFYQFLVKQQLDAVKAKNAGSGNWGSTRGAMAVADRAAGVASQAYFPLLQNLTTRAMSGSSPTAAGVTYERGMGRSQDQAQMAAAARAAGQQKPPQAPAMTAPVAPAAPAYNSAGTSSFGMPYSGGYDVTANTPGYTPSAEAGTGYMMSDSGVQEFNGPGSQYYSFGASPAQPEQPMSQSYAGYDYDPYASGDFGYGGGDYGE